MRVGLGWWGTGVVTLGWFEWTLGGLIVLTQGTTVAPFIYTVF